MSEPRTKPRRGDWCLIEYLPAGYVYVDPRLEDPLPLRAREGRPDGARRWIDHARLPARSVAFGEGAGERPQRALPAGRAGGRIEYVRGRGADFRHIRTVWTLPRGLVIDAETADRTFHTEDEAKAALRECLPASEVA